MSSPAESDSGARAPGALAGVRVVDLTRLLPGPYCTLLLADMGADVVKVEDPDGADFVRWVPPMVGASRQLGAVHVALNRGKRSLALNLKAPEGRDALLALLDKADVLVEGFRPGVLDRLGLGLPVLQARNPGLIVAAITGYGQDGPYRDRAGHDLDYLALSGLLSQVGRASDRPGPLGFQVGDVGGGSMVAALRITAALFERQRTGRGTFLDVSMTEGASAFLVMTLGTSVAGGAAPKRGAEQLSGGLVSYDVYETSDGRYMALGALEPKFWAAFCRAVGRPDWVARQFDGYGDPGSKIAAEVRDLFKSRPRAEWEAVFSAADACCEPVLEVDEVLAHPANRARAPFFTAIHPTEGSFQAVRTPVLEPERAEGSPGPPLLGEHTTEVLAEAGLDGDTIDALIRAGVAKVARAS